MRSCLNCNTEMEDPQGHTGNYQCSNCNGVFTLQISTVNCDRLYLGIALMITITFFLKSIFVAIPWPISLILFCGLVAGLSVMQSNAELFPYPTKKTSRKKSFLILLGNMLVTLGLLATALLTSFPWPLVSSIAAVIVVISLIFYKELSTKNDETRPGA